MNTFLAGFGLGLSLIVAIGAQNAFILRAGLLKQHVFILCSVCAFSDALLILAGVSGLGVLVSKALLTRTPKPDTPARISKASEKAHTEHKINTCCLSKPALKINAFWAPIATIKESPKPNPARKVFIAISETLPHR